MRPEAAEVMRRRAANNNPAEVCTTVLGIPLAGLLSEPIKIVQAPRLTVVLYEAGNSHRQIYTDGRGLPKEYDKPAYFGYSVGHWERDVLVVETGGDILDPQQVGQLAQPFRRLRADRTGSDNGAGLGLSIVAAIASAHRGTLVLQARPGGGLSVAITLPLAAQAQPAGIPA